MTWLKLSDDFSDECARVELSDAAYRTHVEGLQWVMRRETGGWVNNRDVHRFAETADPDAAITELVFVGFWQQHEDGYVIVHHLEHQPEPDLLAKRRALTAERVRRHRRKQAGLDPDVTALQNALPGSGRVGTGRETQTRDGEEQEHARTHARDPWEESA